MASDLVDQQIRQIGQADKPWCAGRDPLGWLGRLDLDLGHKCDEEQPIIISIQLCVRSCVSNVMEMFDMVMVKPIPIPSRVNNRL